jgi:hypothetical protein
MEDIDPVDIDLLTRAVKDESVWQSIVRHPKVADETLRWLARVASPKTQDAIITNQRRILSCLEILTDLRENPQVTQEVMRRAREFEEEFLEKALTWATAVKPQIGRHLDRALAALKAIGVQLAGPRSGETRRLGRKATPRPASPATPTFGSPCEHAPAVLAALVGTREERQSWPRPQPACRACGMGVPE